MEPAFPAIPERRKPRNAASSARSRKAAWRRIDHADIEDTACVDLTATITHRIKSAATDNNAKGGRSGAGTVMTKLFSIDTAGGAVLSKNVKKDVTRLQKGIGYLSQHQRKGLARASRALKTRISAEDRAAAVETAVTSVRDVWGGVVNSSPRATTQHPPRKRPKIKSSPSLSSVVPNVVVSVAGQSVNPSIKDYEVLVMSAAAIETDKHRKDAEVERHLTPVTSALIDVVGEELVNPLSSIQRQSAFMRLSQLKKDLSSDEDISASIAEFIRLLKDSGCNEDSVGLAGGQVVANVFAEDEEADDDESDDDTAASPLKRAQKKRKTKTDRNKFDRHQRELRMISARKRVRLFNSTLDRMKQYIEELAEEEQQHAARAAYKQALHAAKLQAAAAGLNVRFRCGKSFDTFWPVVDVLPALQHSFEEASTEVILPAAVEAAGGSLRKVRLTQIPAAAIKDRIQSAYRRKLTEPPTPLNVANFARIKKQAHRKIKSYKMVVKY